MYPSDEQINQVFQRFYNADTNTRNDIVNQLNFHFRHDEFDYDEVEFRGWWFPKCSQRIEEENKYIGNIAKNAGNREKIRETLKICISFLYLNIKTFFVCRKNISFLI